MIEGLLGRCLVQTDEMIKNLIEIELGYINTSHPDFVSGMESQQLREEHNRGGQHLAPQSTVSEPETNQKQFLNFWPFKNQSKQTELYDSKLDVINKRRKDNERKEERLQKAEEEQHLNLGRLNSNF